MVDFPRDAPPVLYRLARAAGRALVAFYFRKLEIQNGDPLEAPGPAVLAANHPQSIMDALVLGVSTRRVVHFVAHSGLFRNPLRRGLLAGAGVIPVYRPADIEDAQDKNLGTFAACSAVLSRGGVLGIFPEGTSRDERRVERLKTGTARIAFESEAASGFTLGVRVVPVGIHFETPRRFRSRVLLRAGTPLRPGDRRREYEADPREAVQAFTRDLQASLAGQVVHLERREWGALVDDIEAVYREDLLSRQELRLPGGTRFLREAVLAGEIARAVGHFQVRSPGRLDPLARELERYRRLREEAGVSEALLREDALPSVRRTALQSFLPLLAGFPAALWGFLWCGIPYHATRRLVVLRNPDPSKVHWTRLWIGLGVYAVYFPALAWLAWRQLSGWGAAMFLAGLAPAGFFAMAYGRYWRRQRDALRAGWLATLRRDVLLDLYRRRRRVLAEMDALLEEYLRGRKTQPT